jgi:hypothetical protein
MIAHRSREFLDEGVRRMGLKEFRRRGTGKASS